MSDEPNPFETILIYFAKRLRDAPGAARLARLAKSANGISPCLLDDLATLILQLDDVQLVGNDIALHLIEIGYCGAACLDAGAFASALKKRLQHFVDEPAAASAARTELNAHVAWWSMALGRAAKLCRQPAVVLQGG
ncbi:hypothetical protein ACVWXM_006297 [Bradyrhizobium sp. GM7.3]|jgi:hypothetical protein